MNTEENKLWASCLHLIRQHVTEQQYRTWFEPMVFESYTKDTETLLLQVKSPYIYEYIEEHFITLLSKVLRHFFGEGVHLAYRVVTDSENNVSHVVQGDSKRMERQRQRSQGERQTPAPLDAQLNPNQTFENFIEGDSNRLSRSVGLSIAEHPRAGQFNPMFIYGPPGCGKTHLINAIGIKTKEIYPEKRVLYVTARLFQAQFVNATLTNHINDFIGFYQSIDMLLVDDIHEWISAEKTQEAFFHIFNHLFRNNKRIFLVCDRAPAQLEGMQERMLSRFVCGMIAEMERPNVQLCKDILKSKIKRDGLSIEPDVIDFIAQNTTGSVRDLEGVLNSLMAYSIVYNTKVDLRLAERVIRRAVKMDNNPLTMDDILGVVAAHFSLKEQAIVGKSRQRELTQARHIAMYIAKKYTNMPTSRIGKLFGGRDHTTVLHGCQSVSKRLEKEEPFAQEMEQIEEALKIKK